MDFLFRSPISFSLMNLRWFFLFSYLHLRSSWLLPLRPLSPPSGGTQAWPRDRWSVGAALPHDRFFTILHISISLPFLFFLDLPYKACSLICMQANGYTNMKQTKSSTISPSTSYNSRTSPRTVLANRKKKIRQVQPTYDIPATLMDEMRRQIQRRQGSA